MPQKPYVQFLPFRDQMPLMQELFRFRDKDSLDEIQKLWFASTKPDEELYDLWNDPHEVINLAHHDQYQEIRLRLSRELDRWIELTNDPLTLPETELVKRLWSPDGIQHQTQTITITESAGSLQLQSVTEGASIAYQINETIGGKHWLLYTEPIAANSVDSLTGVAIRIGFKQSPAANYYGQ